MGTAGVVTGIMKAKRSLIYIEIKKKKTREEEANLDIIVRGFNLLLGRTLIKYFTYFDDICFSSVRKYIHSNSTKS